MLNSTGLTPGMFKMERQGRCRGARWMRPNMHETRGSVPQHTDTDGHAHACTHTEYIEEERGVEILSYVYSNTILKNMEI